MVTCHLGAGASLAAVQDGISVDTTMGFTPLDGLVMATRSGSVDPGLLLWLEEHAGLKPPSWPRPWSTARGSPAWPGRPTCARSSNAPVPVTSSARLALDVYLHRLRGSVAAMAAAMGRTGRARVHRRGR